MQDGARFNLGRKAEAVFDDYEFNSNTDEGRFSVTQTAGPSHYRSGKIGKSAGLSNRDGFKLTTPTAVVSIRGSASDQNEGTDGFQINLTDGEATVNNVDGTSPQVIQPGESSVVTDPSGQVSVGSSFVPIDGLAPADTLSEVNENYDQITSDSPPPPDAVTTLPGDDSSDTDDTEADEVVEGEGEEGEEEEEGEEGEEEEGEEEEGEEGEEVEEGEEAEAEAEAEVEEDIEEQVEEDVGEEIEEEVGEEIEEDVEEVEEETAEAEEDATEENTEDEVTEEDSTEEGATETDEPVTDTEGTSEEDTGEQVDATEETVEDATDSGAEETTEGTTEETEATEQATAGDASQGDESEGGRADEPAVDGDGTADSTDDGDTSGEETAGSQSEINGETTTDASAQETDTTDTDSAQNEGATQDGEPVQQANTPTDTNADTSAADSGQGEDATGQSDFSSTVDGTSDPGAGQGANTGNDVELETLEAPDTGIGEQAAVEPEAPADPEPVVEELPPDNAPVALDDSEDVLTSDPIELAELILSNDTDIDEGQEPVLASVSELTGSGELAVDINAGSVLYQPDVEVIRALGTEETATATFTYTVSSGDLEDTAQVTLVLKGENDLPTPLADEAETDEDTNLILDVLENDTDPDTNDVLTITGVEIDSEDGNVTISEDGRTLDYEPPQGLGDGESRDVEFTYTVSDGDASASATVSVSVSGIDDAPVIKEEPVEVEADAQEVRIALTDLFDDPDLGTELTVTEVDVDSFNTTGTVIVGTGVAVTGAVNTRAFVHELSQGEVIFDSSIPAGTLVYIPGDNAELAEGEVGFDTFILGVEDESGNTGSGEVRIAIVGKNDAPEAFDDSYTLDEDQILVADDLLVNDSDIDRDDLEAEVLIEPEHGELILNADGSFSYTPNENYNGTDSFVYLAKDPGGLVAEATVNLTINPVDDAPQAVDDEFSGVDNRSIQGDLLENDFDVEEDPFDIVLQPSADPENGHVTLSADGTFNYLANDGFSGTDQFKYQVTDGEGNTTEATVFVSVEVIEEPPVAGDDTYQLNNNSELIVGPDQGLLANDSDPDRGALSISPDLVDGPDHGTVSVNEDGSFTYRPESNFVGSDSFTYQVVDINGETATAEASIEVLRDNLIPTAQGEDFTVVEGASLERSAGDGLLSNDIDPDGEPLSVLTDPVVDPRNGTVTINDDGSFNYTPNPDFVGIDEFTYAVIDSFDETSQATVTITVEQSNTPPVVGNDAYTLDENTTFTTTLGDNDLLRNDSDPEEDELAVQPTLAAEPLHGTVTVNPDGTFSYTPEPGFFGDDTFTYVVSDPDGLTNEGLVTLTVLSTNQGPDVVNDGYTVGEGGNLSTTAGSNGLLENDVDPDGDVLTVSPDPVSGPLNGAVSIANDGSFVYTPNSGFSGSDSFVYEVTDPEGLTAQGTASINVVSGNSAPVATDDVYFTSFNTTLNVIAASGPPDHLLFNDSDPDADSLTLNITPVIGPTKGTVTILSDGGFDYTPTPGATGVDTFTYEISDPDGATSQATATINIITPTTNIATDGTWNSPTTWSEGTAPNFAELVSIPAGVTVSTLGDSLDFDGLEVDGNVNSDGGSYNGPVTVDTGTITHQNTATINGPLQINATGTFVLNGVTASQILTVNDDISNFGVFELTGGLSGGGDEGAALLVNTGYTFVNESGGVVVTTGLHDSRSITGNLVNNGLIDIDYTLTLFNDGALVNNANGTIDIASGSSLILNSGAGTGNLELGAGSSFVGSGLLDFEGNQIVTLTSDFVWASPPTDFLNAQVTFNGATPSETLILNGLLLVQSEDEIFDVPIQINGSGELELEGVSVAMITTFNQNINNEGIIELIGGLAGGGDEGVHLSLGGGAVLTNLGTGTIRSTGLHDSRLVSGDVVNQGLIDADYQLTISGDVTHSGTLDADANVTINTVGTFDTTVGTIDIGTSATVNINGGTTEIGTGTVIQGTGGTLQFSGTQNVDILTDFTYNAASIATDTASGAITFDGPGKLIVDGAVFRVQSSDDVFNAVVDTTATGELNLVGFNAGQITTFNADINNAGIIRLDGGVNGGLNENVNLVLAGAATLNNLAGGTIVSEGPFDLRTITGDIVNDGTIDVNYTLTLSNDGASVDSTNGSLDILTGTFLGIDSGAGSGELRLGAGSSILGGGTLNFVGTQTVMLTGDFNWDSVTTLTDFRNSAVTFNRLTAADDLLIDGLLVVQSEDDIFNAEVQIGAGGELELQGVSNLQTTTFNENITNAGRLELTGGVNGGLNENVVLQLGGAATLTNLAGATIHSTGGFDLRIINGDVINQGLIDADYPLTINGNVTHSGTLDADANVTINTVGTFDTAVGTIDIGTSATVNINGGTTEIGTGTVIQGTGGTLQFSGTQNVDILTDFTYNAASIATDTASGAITFDGPGKLIVDGAVFRVQSSDDVFNAVVDTTATGELNLVGFNAGQITTFNADINNAGIIRLDGGVNGGLNENVNLVLAGAATLNNLAGGTIVSEGPFDLRTITGDIVNDGTIDVNYTLTLAHEGAVVDSSNGTFDIASGTTLLLSSSTNGELKLGSGSVIQGDGTLNFFGDQFITLTSDFTWTATNIFLNFADSVVTINPQSVGDDLIVDGLFSFSSIDDIFNVEVKVGVSGELELFGNNVLRTTTFNENITNDGLIELKDGLNGGGDEGVHLLLGSGAVLTNMATGIIRSTGPYDSREITGDIVNNGLIDVDYTLTLSHEGAIVDSSNGTIDIASGATLLLNSSTNGELKLGSGSVIQGDGTLNFFGDQTVTLTSDFTWTATNIFANFANSVVTFNPQAPGDDLIVDGLLSFSSIDDIFNVEVKVGTSGELELFGNNTLRTTTFTENITNEGLIELKDGLAGGGDEGVHLLLSGGAVLTNMSTGIIRSTGPHDSREITGDINNDGTIDVDYALTVNGNITNTGLVDLTAAQTLTLNSMIDNQSGGLVHIKAGTHNFDITNNVGGTILVNEGVANLNFSGGGFVQNGDLDIVGTINGSAQINLSGGFTNAGTITMDNTFNGSALVATLTLGGGTLTNTGTILTDSTGGNTAGNRNITNGDVNNQGTITINHVTHFDGSFINSGNLSVAAGKVLLLNGPATTFNAGTVLSGTGEIQFNTIQILTLNTNITLDNTTPILNLNNDVTVNGTGTLIIENLGQQTLSGDQLNADLDVRAGGQLKVTGNSTITSGTLFNAGQILVDTDGLGDTVLTFPNGFLSSGTITLNSADSVTTRNITLTVGTGTLTNNGVIESTDTGGMGGTRTINADINGTGGVDVDHPLTINGNLTTGGLTDLDAALTVTGVYTNTGQIDLLNASSLVLSSPLQNNSGGSLAITTLNIGFDIDNNGGVVEAYAGTSTLSGTLTQSGGQLRVEGTVGGTATLIVSNGFTQSGKITLDSSYGAAARDATFTVSTGTLVNASGGEIEAVSTGGRVDGFRNINADVDNQGVIDVDHQTHVIGTTFITDNGTLEVDADLTLQVGDVTFGTATNLTGSGDVFFNTATNLNLSSNYVIASGDPGLIFDGTVTVKGPGDLAIQNLAVQALTGDHIQTNLDIQAGGKLEVLAGASTMTGTTLTQSGQLLIDGNINSSAILTVSNGFTNNDLITLDSTYGAGARDATLSVSSGTLTNAAGSEIESISTGTRTDGFRNINADVDNQGVIDVDHQTHVTGTTFITDNGTLEVDADLTLQIGDVTFGTATNLTGSGDVFFNTATNLNLSSNYVIASGDPGLIFDGTVTVKGPGDLAIQNLAVQALTGDHIQTNLDIQAGGKLEVLAGASTMTGTTLTQSGQLLIDGNINGSAILTVSNGFTNNDLITLDSTYGAGARDATLTVTSGTLFNPLGSVIETVSTGGQSTGFRYITAQVDNQGDLDISHNTFLGVAGAAHLSSGAVDILTARTLTITGTSLALLSGNLLAGSGTLDVSGLTTFTNDGEIEPGGEGVVGTLTIVGDTTQSASSMLTIDVASDSSYDVLDASTYNFDVDGNLDLNFLPGHGILNATITILNYGGNTGGSFVISHNLGPAYSVTQMDNGTSLDIIISSTFNLFDGSTDNTWEDPSNWSNAAVPVMADDVLINSTFAVTYNSAITITSLTIEDTASLDIQSGSLTLNQASTVLPTAALTLSGGTLTTVISTEIDGTFNWTSGTVNGAGTVDVGGTFNPTTAGVKTLDGILNVGGISSISNVTIGGTGTLTIDGDLTLATGISVSSSVTVFGGGLLTNHQSNSVNGTITTIDSGGELIIEGSGGASIFTVGAGSLANAGTITLDSLGSTSNLTISGGALTNTGTIQSVNVGGGGSTRTVDGPLVSTGLIDAQYDLTILIDSAAPETLDLVGGTIQASSGTTITIDAGNDGITRVGTGTGIWGPGTINLIGSDHTLEVAAGNTFTLQDEALEFGGAVTVTAPGAEVFQIGNGGHLELDGSDTFDSALTIQSAGLLFSTLSNTLDGTTIIDPGGELIVEGNGGAAVLTLGGGALTNAGVITLDSLDSSSSLVISGGVLTNTGMIQAVNFAGGGNTRTIDGPLVSSGFIDARYDLTILIDSVAPETLDIVGGSIFADFGTTITIDAGNDGITRVDGGTSFTGDGTVDLVGGAHTLDIMAGTLTLTDSTLAFGGTVTVSGAGSLTIGSPSGELALTADTVSTSLTVAGGGKVFIEAGISTLGGTTFIDAGGALSIVGSNAGTAQATIGGALTNSGILTLDNDGSTSAATLFVSGGTVTNNGTLWIDNTSGGGTRTIDGSLDNTGYIDADYNVNISITAAAEEFDSVGGTIDVDTGVIVTIDAGSLGTTRFGTGTMIYGDGVVDLVGADHDLILDSNFTLNSSTLTLGGVVTTSGAGTFVVGDGGDIAFTSDTFDTGLTVQDNGKVEVTAGNTFLNAASMIDMGGALEIVGAGASATLTLTSSLTNNGLLSLDNDGGAAAVSLTISGGSFINFGRVHIKDTSGGGTRNINGLVDNQGEFDVDYDLTINGASLSHQNSGEINVASGVTLSIGEASSSLNIVSSGRLSGDGTVSIAGTLNSDGTISPGNSIGTLTITGNVVLTGNSVWEIEVDDVDTLTRDQVNISGSLAPAGTIDLIFGPNHNVDVSTSSEVFTIGTYGSGGGSFSVNHNLGSGINATATLNANNVEITLTDDYEKTYDNGAASSEFGSDDNWDPNGALLSTDDVLIDGTFGVTQSTVTHHVVNSLTLDDTATLSISGGSITLNGNSRTAVGTTLRLFAANGADLVVGDSSTDLLTIDGTFDWDEANVIGFGEVVINGTLDADSNRGRTLDATLRIASGGIANIGDSATGTDSINGTGLITNEGTVTIYHLVDVGVVVDNEEGASWIVAGDTGNATYTIDAAFTNYGTFSLDNLHASAIRNATVDFDALGSFTNEGTLEFIDTNGSLGARTFDAAGKTIINNGVIDVQYDGLIRIDSLGTLDTTYGTINVAADEQLEIAVQTTGGTTTISDMTEFSGGGDLLFSGGTTALPHIIDVTTDFTLDAAMPQWSFGGNGDTIQLSGSGVTFTVDPGASLDLSGDQTTAGLTFVNKGNLTLSGNNVEIDGPFQNESGALLTVSGFITSTNEKGFTNPFTNEGTIEFDQDGGVLNRIEIAGGVGILTNQGTFRTRDSNTSGGQRIFKGTFVNEGLLEVIDFGFELNASAAAIHLNNGDIVIGPAMTLETGSGDDLTNQTDGKISGSGILDVSASSFINDGIILPGGGLTTGTLQVNLGTSTFNDSSVIDIELAGVGDHDILNFVGTDPTLGGTLVISTISFTPVDGDSFTIITDDGTLQGFFDVVEGLDTVDASKQVILDFTQNAASITLDAVDTTYGTASTTGDDTHTGSGTVDIVVTDDGNDTVNNIGSAGDIVYGQDGDDKVEIVDNLFKRIDGIDTLLLSTSIDLTGLDGLVNMERIDMTNASPDTLQLHIGDLVSFVGDNSLDFMLPGGSEKMIIDGDATDTVILNGQDLSDISGGTLAAAGITSDYIDVNIDGENYIKFVHAGLDLELYVHVDLVDDTPM